MITNKNRFDIRTVQYKGNPYIHTESKRECITNSNRQFDCSWCGSKPKRLYIYNNATGQFCNQDCYKSYHLIGE